jgi:phosphoribosylglycinamide formyltransferase 1
MNKIAVFASGRGTNAENIIRYFKNHPSIKVGKIYTNNPLAGVIKVAEYHEIECKVFEKSEIYQTETLLKEIIEENHSHIILAGFLWLIPESFVQAFPNKIINIHPALLPKFGGKGMYGMNVHKAVIVNKEKETGISIHYVNANYDEGDLIFQEKCTVEDFDTPENIAEKVHVLEYAYFPKIIEQVIFSNC